MSLRLFATALLALSCAGAQSLNDFTTYIPKAVPALPAAGGTFVDPNFGTTILRVTDANTGGGASFMPEYSSLYPAFNADSTHFVLQGYELADLDIPNHRVSNLRSMPYTPTGYIEGLYWSHTNPDLAYVFGGSVIYAYSVSANTYTPLLDVATLAPGTTTVGNRGMSDSDTRFAVYPDGKAGYTCILDISTKTLPYCIADSRTGNTGKGTIDGTGRYLLISSYIADSQTDTVVSAPAVAHIEATRGNVYGSVGTAAINGTYNGVRKVNATDSPFTNWVTSPQMPWVDDGHIGLHDSAGVAMVASMERQNPLDGCVNAGAGWVSCTDPTSVGRFVWSWDTDGVKGQQDATGHWTWTPVVAGANPPFWPLSLAVFGEGEIHFQDTTTPAVVINADATGNMTSIVTPAGASYTDVWSFASTEGPKLGICQAAYCTPAQVLDGFGRKNNNVCRVAKHYSDVTVMANSDWGYWAQPHAIGDPSNKVVLFGSNYGGAVGYNRIDAFIAFIDGKCGTPFSAAPAPTSVPAVSPSGIVPVAVNATQQFTATQGPVTWSVTGPAPTGSISSTGLYTAPASVPSDLETVCAKNAIGSTCVAVQVH